MRCRESFATFLLLSLAGVANAEPVTVTLVAADGGGPIGGATIARLANDRTPREPAVVATTDERGRVTLDVDPRERTAFLATKPGACATTFGFWAAVPRTHEARVAKPTQWTGRVVNADGTPAAGAIVELVDSYPPVAMQFNFFRENSPLALKRTTHARADGRFAIDVDRSRPGEQLRARDDAGHVGDAGAIYAKAFQRAATDGTLTIRLDGTAVPLFAQRANAPATRPAEPTLTLRLRVVDDATGAPIGDVRVTPGGGPSPDQGAAILPTTASLRFADGEPILFAFDDDAWAYLLRVEADGYATTSTRLVKGSERDADVELRMKRATTATLDIVGPDDKPATGAQVYLATPTVGLQVPLTRGWHDPAAVATSGADGVARFAMPDEACRAAIVADAGWAEIDLTVGGVEGRAVKLEPWASVTLRLGDGRPLGRYVDAQAQTGYSVDAGCLINWTAREEFDADGTLVMPRWRAGTFSPTVMSQEPIRPLANVEWSHFEVRTPPLKAGESRDVKLMGGSGRVVAQLAEVPGMEWSFITLRGVGPVCALPDGLDAMTPDAREKAVAAAMKATPKGSPRPDGAVGTIYLRPTARGEIGSSGLAPGTYLLTASATPRGDRRAEGTSANRYFVVGERERVDLGVLAIDRLARPAFAVGDVAPALKATTLDGAAFDLAALRGKWVLLDFWGTWCGFCIAEEPTYRDAHEGWAIDGRLTMVSLAVDDTPEKVREHLKTHALPWTHVVLGDREQTDVPQRFGVDGYPSVMLISPEGKLVATGLRGGRLRDALIEHLGAAAPPRKIK